MLIKKEHLETLWYENENGERISEAGFDIPPTPEVMYQVSRFPAQLTTSYLKLISPDEVDKCRHPRRYIKRTFGWIDGIVGRECMKCGGTQTKKKWRLWPRKWDGSGSRQALAFNCRWSDDLALAIVNNSDYSLS